MWSTQALVCVLVGMMVTFVEGNTIFTDDSLVVKGMNKLVNEVQQVLPTDLSISNHHQKEQREEVKRFSQSPERLALYEKSEHGARYFTHGFGNRLNSMLKRVLENHPRREEFKEALAKKEQLRIEHHMLTMRDGIKLSTLFIFPPMEPGEKRSTMMSRSPYAPTSDQVADVFTLMNGFVAVVQDQRGTFLSEGQFTMWHDDAEDGEDTLNWILAQEWSNGKVFGVGISADGCGLASMLRLNPSPKFSGALYQWASANGHESTYQGGSFRAGLISGWMVLQAPLTKGVSLKETLPDILAHWKLEPKGWWENIQGPGKWHGVKWPTVHVTGWWDIFAAHQLNFYNGIRKDASDFEHRIVVGPVGHCILGLPEKDDPLVDVVEAKAIELGYGFASELFGGYEERGHYFKDQLDLINIYVMGSRKDGRRGEGKVGHYWSSFKNWPKTHPERLFLGPMKMLLRNSPPSSKKTNKRNLRGEGEKDSSAAELDMEDFVEYTYDPHVPTLTHGGNNLVIHLLGFGCGAEDQTPLEQRKEGVVSFDMTDVLTEPLALTGHVKAVLYVSTTALDTDFHVSLNDVHPNGGPSMQVRYGLQRLRLRDSTEYETIVSDVIPGKVYKVPVDMWFTSYVVAPGHKLRVTITSSNTPYFAINGNTGRDDDQYGLKQGEVATNRIYFTEEFPSHVELPIVDINDLPKNEKISN